ncbi:LCP family protein [Rhodococcus sp. WMMA185]|uniref:LCP family protein n=1 Tax=Rhodococcus sp. WMMA185 TaxID=679318 RepID=UPI001E4BBAAE|nr:LCP family protein [Rhodococcus sp. WMMA185]
MIRRTGRGAPPAPQRAWSQAPPSHAPQPQRVRSAPPRGHAPTQVPQPYRDEPASPPGAPGHRPPPPSTTRPRPPEPPRQRRPKRKRRWGRGIGILFLLLILVLAGATYYLDTTLNRIDALAAYPGRIADTPGTNWLLVGSDSREGLTPEQEQELSTGGDTGGGRTDTIMIVHVPSGSGPATMVSIPRDSYVPIPGYGQDKINAAFAFGGPQLLVQTVEEATGLHMDHYAEIGFDGFAGMVDAIGGVQMCLDNPIDDPLAGINLGPGCQELSGTQALGFVRSRATALADIDRMDNQRMFMSALMTKVASPETWLNPFRVWPLITGIAASLSVDERDHIWNLAALAWALRGDMVTTTVPIASFQDVAGSGNVVVWDRDRASQFFGALANDQQLPPELVTTGP